MDTGTQTKNQPDAIEGAIYDCEEHVRLLIDENERLSLELSRVTAAYEDAVDRIEEMESGQSQTVALTDVIDGVHYCRGCKAGVMTTDGRPDMAGHRPDCVVVALMEQVHISNLNLVNVAMERQEMLAEQERRIRADERARVVEEQRHIHDGLSCDAAEEDRYGLGAGYADFKEESERLARELAEAKHMSKTWFRMLNGYLDWVDRLRDIVKRSTATEHEMEWTHDAMDALAEIPEAESISKEELDRLIAIAEAEEALATERDEGQS